MAENIGYGQQDPYDVNTPFSAIAFVIRMMTARMVTMKIVRVEAVHLGDGDPPATATVDVLPLVNQVDGNFNSSPHGTVFGIPCWRMQGGGGAVIVEPAVGDVGLLICSDRDISAVKATGGDQSNPGSARMFDIADGIYLGGILGAAPTSYVRFSANGGLKMVDGFGNVLETLSTGIAFTTAPGGTFKVNAVNVGPTHVHSGVTTGAGVSGPPVP